MKSAAVTGAVLAAGMPASKAVMAQGATPAADEGMGLPPLPEGALVVAQGLYNPKFIAVADDGTLYITESGVGGDEVISQPEHGTSEVGATPVAAPADATPVAEEAGPPSTRGYTGQVSRVTPDGTQSVVASGLASYSDGVGPHGITIEGGEVYFAIGGMAPSLGIESLDGENAVHRLDPDAGTVEQVAYLGQYEIDNNPDGTDINPNLYGLDGAPDGSLTVADAGGNTLYTVDPATGEFELLSIVPDLTGLPGAPADAEPRQAVPTGVISTELGTYVAILSEGFPPGTASVVLLNADGSYSAAGGTLFYNVNIKFGPDQQLYAVEIFGPSDDPNMPGPGRVVRVYNDGTVEPVVEGLFMPHALNFDVAGNMYIGVNSLISAPGMPAGMVIRMDGIAAPA